MEILSFLLRYRWVIIFYIGLILFLFWKRKHLAVQAKVIVLYRTLLGIKFIRKMAQKYRQWVILLGYIGVGAAYVGLVLISVLLIMNLYNLFAHPDSTSGVSLVLPGINIPGVGVLSFWYWLIAIFIIAVVHEFSHGVVAKAHGLKINSTGLVVLGPIIGAFVEPDEKKVEKQKDIVQYSIFAAGPFSNILLGVVAVLLLGLVFTPLQNIFVEPAGFAFESYYGDGYPAEKSGLEPGMVINQLDGKKVNEFMDFYDVTYCSQPGEEIVVGTKEEGNFTLVTTSNPDQPDKAFIGVKTSYIKNEFVLKEKYEDSPLYSGLYAVIAWLAQFMRWLYLLSIGIGLFNLLPLPIVDGGRIFKLSLEKIYGQKKGTRKFGKFSLFFLLLLLANLLIPAFRWMLGL